MCVSISPDGKVPRLTCGWDSSTALEPLACTNMHVMELVGRKLPKSLSVELKFTFILLVKMQLHTFSLSPSLQTHSCI